jgi:8-oxo-dGTP diphosphatase
VVEPTKRLFPIVTADVALFTLMDHQLRVLLIKRANNPTPGGWALPGSVLKPDIDRSVNDTALRALASKTRVVLPYLEQVPAAG